MYVICVYALPFEGPMQFNEIAKVDKDVLPSDYISTLLLLATTPTKLSASIRLFNTSGRVYTTWFNTSTLLHRLYMFVLWTAIKPVAWRQEKHQLIALNPQFMAS